ncbi:TetR/AcrR family transcriptional regulator [Arenibacter sp. ARW7G5Y1]|uniref:TetR/AcrR family transcriptional regulator n=1 Tax=Arenibacter sp. ARW7G5Y1 TaxID=2135619 RepID=UPI000D751AFE|nr:TetR/AcrR family transcriptional regulator [Arenibacter sp. ARW7G5Y1]PXX31403.1 TetR family transcriptional regulator [Arenibacter sp. ARW7G5Y1]
MENQEEFLEFAISKFLKFGSKRFTLDDLAHEMGISKKTIYRYFSSKEEIVQESLKYLLTGVQTEITEVRKREKNNPIQGVISIYRIGLNNLKKFSPSFLLGLQKYYPRANELFNEFRAKEIHDCVFDLLQQAQIKGQIRMNVNLELTSLLYLNRLEYVLFSSNNLFDKYSSTELLEHLVINNLRGIATQAYASKLS